MASKQATEHEPDELLDVIDQTLDRLKVLYEQYFLGIQKQPPAYMHSDVERKLRDVTQLQMRNTRLRYRFATVQQKFGAYNSYWRRTLRQIENGTYARNLSKIGRDAAKTGAAIPEEILAAMPKRMRDQVVRDRETALAQAARRTRSSGTQAAVQPPAEAVKVAAPVAAVAGPVAAVAGPVAAPPVHAAHVHPRTVPSPLPSQMPPASRPPPVPASARTGPMQIPTSPQTGPIPIVSPSAAAAVIGAPAVRRPAPPPLPIADRTGPVRKFPPAPPTTPVTVQPPSPTAAAPPIPPPIPKPKPKP